MSGPVWRPAIGVRPARPVHPSCSGRIEPLTVSVWLRASHGEGDGQRPVASYLSLSGGRISTSIASLPGPMASVVAGATSAGSPGALRARRLLVPPVLRAGAALRAGALRPAAFRAGERRPAVLAVVLAAFLVVLFEAFFAVFLTPDFFAVPFRAVLRPVLLRAAAFFAPPPFRADLPLDFRAFATF
jgi:hypothetical protein